MQNPQEAMVLLILRSFQIWINDKTEKRVGMNILIFINALIALDNCNKKNGTIELSKAHNGDFEIC